MLLSLTRKKLGSNNFLVHQVFEVKVLVWKPKEGKNRIILGLTCVPDVLDPYVCAGSEKQPLDGDEEEAYDV